MTLPISRRFCRLCQALCLPLLIVGVTMGGFLSGCNPQTTENAPKKKSIGVTVLRVRENHLGRVARVTGSVVPWKEEKLRFQISGQLSRLVVKTPGTQVQGTLKDETGKVIHEGDVIAELNPEPYQLALSQAESQRDAAQTKLDAAELAVEVSKETIKAAQSRVDIAKTELEQLQPLNLKLAQEQTKTATKELDLTKQAYQQEDATHVKLLQARTAHTVAQIEEKKAEFAKILKEKELHTYMTDLAKAKMEKQLREAEVKISRSQLEQAEAMVRKAERDLEKCKLRAPFSGIVANIRVNPGVLVDPSVVVVDMILMDPIRVDLSISMKRLKDFYYGNEVNIYAVRESGPGKPQTGIVYYVQTTADPSTRTFLATVVTRNFLRELNPIDIPHKEEYLPLQELSGVVHRDPQGRGPLYVDVRCIQKDEQGEFVWKFNKTGEHTGHIEKVRIETGKDIISVITWVFREMVNAGGINPNDVLLLDPPKEVADGKKAIALQKDWMFRPGELVEVEYDNDFGEGIFLPSETIFQEDRDGDYSYYVFVIEKQTDKNGEEKLLAVKRPIVKTKVDDLWRINDGLKPGDMVVTLGCYNVDNQYKGTRNPVPVHIVQENTLMDLVEGYYIKGPVK